LLTTFVEHVAAKEEQMKLPKQLASAAAKVRISIEKMREEEDTFVISKW
jgi:hypothetical protein